MKIEIKDEVLSNYLMFKLDKDNAIFTDEELSSIDELFLDCHELNNFNFTDILVFDNLKAITLRNFKIKTTDLYILSKLRKLRDITLDNCMIENPNVISGLNLERLSLINCDIDNYDFIYILNGLKELTVIKGSIDIDKLNKLNNLRYLQLSDSTINNNSKLMGLNIEKLYIDNTNISNLSFLNKFYSLKVLGIDEEQYNNNKELINNLIKDNISVLLDGLVSIEEDGETNV